jgi:hypothetical protein
MWPAIGQCFIEKDGVLVHKRLDRERAKQETFRHRQSEKGKASAVVREGNRTSTEMQPDLNRNSTVVEMDTQPKSNSAICNLQSAICDLQTAVSTRAPVALAGSLPRDHIRHAWCSSRGKCVPDFLHGEFCRSVDAEHPERASLRLKAFYEAVELGWPAGPIGNDPVKLWRQEFAAKFPSVAPVKPAADLVAMARAKIEADEARYGKRR